MSVDKLTRRLKYDPLRDNVRGIYERGQSRPCPFSEPHISTRVLEGVQKVQRLIEGISPVMCTPLLYLQRREDAVLSAVAEAMLALRRCGAMELDVTSKLYLLMYNNTHGLWSRSLLYHWDELLKELLPHMPLFDVSEDNIPRDTHGSTHRHSSAIFSYSTRSCGVMLLQNRVSVRTSTNTQARLQSNCVQHDSWHKQCLLLDCTLI